MLPAAPRLLEADITSSLQLGKARDVLKIELAALHLRSEQPERLRFFAHIAQKIIQ